MLNKSAKLNPNLFNQKSSDYLATRDGYGDGLLEAGKQNKDVVALCADLTKSTRSQKFRNAYPDRFIEVGVAEQNMMGIAAGLALSGKIPFATSFGVFSPGRNWDQLRISVCYSQANVKIASSHTGLSVGEDGATHQALEDIALTRCLPNLTVLAPADYEETKKAVIEAAKMKGPVYLRFARNKTPIITTNGSPFQIGKAQVYTEGDDVTLIACGPVLYEALLAAKDLADKGVNARVINCHTIKPLDEDAIIKAAKETKTVVTIEDHQVKGGLGSAVAEVLAKNHPVPMEMVGVQDKFGESGSASELWDKYGLTAPHIIKTVEKVLKRN